MLPSNVRIFVCAQPTDMRKSFDGLALSARQVVGEDPQGGALFIFLNKDATRLKALWWDRNGYCLLYKRLHRAVFVRPSPNGGQPAIRIDGRALAELLAGHEKISEPKRRAA